MAKSGIKQRTRGAQRMKDLGCRCVSVWLDPFECAILQKRFPGWALSQILHDLVRRAESLGTQHVPLD